MPPKKRRRGGRFASSSGKIDNPKTSETGGIMTDDEELPDLTRSPKKERNFCKDDIVWAPMEGNYWPAVVTSVSRPYVRFLRVNGYRKYVYKMRANKLISFDDEATNHRFKSIGGKRCVALQEAYDLVIKYFLKKSEDKEISARRYLTHSMTTGLNVHKDVLYRLGRDVGATEDVELVIEDYVSESEGEESEETVIENTQDEFDREFESLPEIDNKVLLDLEKEANDILPIIASAECLNYLKEVRSGTIESARNKMYPHPELKLVSGLGPFTNHKGLTDKFLDIIDKHIESLGIDDLDYRLQVLVPEAIIYALMRAKNVDKESASRTFMELSSIVGSMS